MCGRYTLENDGEDLFSHFDLDEPPTQWQARYNLAPTQPVPVICSVEGVGRHWYLMRWGLIPTWAKETSIGNRLINARSETVADKPAFRAAIRRRRCLIPATGFYEWRGQRGHKQPYWIGHQARRPIAFAGIWEKWRDPNGEQVIQSCTILTKPANRLVQPIHERMPVILTPDVYGLWLDKTAPLEALQPLYAPQGYDWLTLYPVSPDVSSPGVEGRYLAEPLPGLP